MAKKEKIIKDGILIKCVSFYVSDLIQELLPELKEEHSKWLKEGFTRKKRKKAREFRNFIEYLEAKYGKRSNGGNKKQYNYAI